LALTGPIHEPTLRERNDFLALSPLSFGLSVKRGPIKKGAEGLSFNLLVVETGHDQAIGSYSIEAAVVVLPALRIARFDGLTGRALELNSRASRIKARGWADKALLRELGLGNLPLPSNAASMPLDTLQRVVVNLTKKVIARARDEMHHRVALESRKNKDNLSGIKDLEERELSGDYLKYKIGEGKVEKIQRLHNDPLPIQKGMFLTRTTYESDFKREFGKDVMRLTQGDTLRSPYVLPANIGRTEALLGGILTPARGNGITMRIYAKPGTKLLFVDLEKLQKKWSAKILQTKYLPEEIVGLFTEADFAPNTKFQVKRVKFRGKGNRGPARLYAEDESQIHHHTGFQTTDKVIFKKLPGIWVIDLETIV